MKKTNPKIKILYTISNFDTSGSGKVLYDLAKGLDKTKFEVEILAGNSKGIFFKEIENLGLPIYIRDARFPIRPFYNLIFRINPYRKFLSKQNFDIVHSWHWSSDWTEILATRLAGSKFIYTKKAMSWGVIHWKIKSFLSNFIITINDEMKDYFPNKKHQKLIPLGIDTSFYNPDLFSKKPKSNFFRIITIANLVPVKGIEILIQSIYKLNNNKITLEIVGDTRDNYVKGLENLIVELNLQEQVFFSGKHIDVRPFLVNSDLFVIPTLNEGRKEGMPMALVEAMSMGISVLGSDISGINFVLKNFPELLFEASNIEILTNKINQLYDKSELERNEIGNGLRAYCIQNFSMDMFIKKHEELYTKIAKR